MDIKNEFEEFMKSIAVRNESIINTNTTILNEIREVKTLVEKNSVR